MYIGDKPVELMAGTDTDGEILYPLCGVLSHMGYAYSCDGMGSWQLLRETEEPVYRVAELIGIRNYTYFCRLFKEKTGLTPLQYRREADA